MAADDSEDLRLGFIGAGMMASAMINGIIAAKVIASHLMLCLSGVRGFVAVACVTCGNVLCPAQAWSYPSIPRTTS